MDYNRYKEALKERVEEQLENVEVQYMEVVDNNDTKKEMLALETKDDPVIMRIHMDDIYKQYVATQDLEESKKQVVLLYRSRKQIPEEWMDYSWEQIRSRIRIRLVRLKGNEEFLKNRPYKEVLDMTMIFVAALQKGEEDAAVHISLQHMRAWEIDTEELYRAAMENLEKEEFSLTELGFYLSQMTGEDLQGGPDLYALTTENRMYGARAMFRKDMLKEVAAKKGSNLFILPSSIHEVLLLPESDGYHAEGLAAMVSTINHDPDIVRSEDVLTDSVYYYDRESGEVRIAA